MKAIAPIWLVRWTVEQGYYYIEMYFPLKLEFQRILDMTVILLKIVLQYTVQKIALWGGEGFNPSMVSLCIHTRT